MFSRLVLALTVGSTLAGCGDLGDPLLLSATVMLNDVAVQTLEIDISGSNFFTEDVHPDSAISLDWDEPIQLPTAQQSIQLVDALDGVVPVTMTQRLTEVIVTPNSAMPTGENYTLMVDRGIDDEANNTTDFFVNITFFVDTP